MFPSNLRTNRKQTATEQCTSIAERPVVRVVQHGKPARESKLDGGHEERR